MPHSRMTLRYLPASRILCFHGCRKTGIHAPPGRRVVFCRGGGTTAVSEGVCLPATFDDDANDEPSRS
jgi:hypothetical protein